MRIFEECSVSQPNLYIMILVEPKFLFIYIYDIDGGFFIMLYLTGQLGLLMMTVKFPRRQRRPRRSRNWKGNQAP
jgi:hypothetical protein